MIKVVLNLLLALLIWGCSAHTKPQPQNPSEIGAKIGDPVYIRIFKKEHKLELWMKVGKVYKLYKSYPILRLSGRLGPKLKEGDHQSPEGVYKVTLSSLNPYSKYHLGINIGYPNLYDRKHFYTGSAIMIHGGNKSIGCFAMGDTPIEEIYRLVEAALQKGQPFVYVAIFPFRMEEDQMAKYDHYPYLHDFWKSLQNIYFIFEHEHIPPKVIVLEEHYLVEKVEEKQLP